MQKINIKQIQADPLQPRQEFDSGQLKQLEQSIAQNGILQPIILEKIAVNKYLLVDGERRYRCATKLGFKVMPAEVVGKMTSVERLIKRFHIQEQHRNWSPFDKARAIKMMTEEENISPKDLSDMLGVGQSTLSQLLLLLNLSKRSQEFAETKRVPYQIVNFVSRISSYIKVKAKADKVEKIFIDRYLEGKVSTSELSDYTFAFKNETEKVANTFIKKGGFNADEALNISGMKESRGLARLLTVTGWFGATLTRAKTRGANKMLTSANVKLIEKVIGQMEDFIKTAKVLD